VVDRFERSANQGDLRTQIDYDDLVGRYSAMLMNESAVVHYLKFTEDRSNSQVQFNDGVLLEQID
jgi:hypothetical protein